MIPTRSHLAIFDLDGTLAASKSPATPDMGERLARLLEIMPTAVMSGGAYKQFQVQLLPALPPTARLERLFLFPVSASQCYRFKDGLWSAVYNLAFSAEEKKRVLGALNDALAETGLSKPPEKVWGERIEDRGAQITFSALGQQAPIEEKEVWDPTREKRMPLKEALDKKLPDFTIMVNATTSVDITRKGVTKAYGIKRLPEIAGIQIDGMVYIGDALFPGGNDAIVIPTGIRTYAVTSPRDTAEAIEKLIAGLL